MSSPSGIGWQAILSSRPVGFSTREQSTRQSKSVMESTFGSTGIG